MNKIIYDLYLLTSTMDVFQLNGKDITTLISSYLDHKSWINFQQTSKFVNKCGIVNAFEIELKYFENIRMLGNIHKHEYYRYLKCDICGDRQDLHPARFHQCFGCMQYGHSHKKCPDKTMCSDCKSPHHLIVAHRCERCGKRGHGVIKCQKKTSLRRYSTEYEERIRGLAFYRPDFNPYSNYDRIDNLLMNKYEHI